jgi:hypothetical protein
MSTTRIAIYDNEGKYALAVLDAATHTTADGTVVPK